MRGIACLLPSLAAVALACGGSTGGDAGGRSADEQAAATVVTAWFDGLRDRKARQVCRLTYFPEGDTEREMRECLRGLREAQEFGWNVTASVTAVRVRPGGAEVTIVLDETSGSSVLNSDPQTTRIGVRKVGRQWRVVVPSS